MSCLEIMKRKNIPLPPSETEEGLTANDIMHVIRSFYLRMEKINNDDVTDYAEGSFLELLKDYPKSMCSQHLTETMKELIALIYFESKPEPEKKDPLWEGFSYEQLALYFCRSKSTIHQAITQNEIQVKQLLAEVTLRTKAKNLALQDLIAEEREKLRENKKIRNNYPKTNKRTPLL